MIGACIHCDGWGCVRCGKPAAPRLGEQCDPELAEFDARVAAAVRVEREACAKAAEQWLNRPRCKATALDIATAIRARGGP